MSDLAKAELRTCPFFAELDARSLGLLAAIAQRRTYAAGERIVRQGEETPGMFVVTRGQVRVFKLAPNGKEHVLNLPGPGGTFLEVAVLGNFPCPAFAEAVEPTNCLLLPTGAFRKAVDEDHPLCRQLLFGMAKSVRRLVGLMEDIVLRDAAGRVAQHLLTLHGEQGETIELPALKKHLASHLNLTSETLSRTLRRLTQAGLIDSNSGQVVHICDPTGLEEIAEGVSWE